MKKTTQFAARDKKTFLEFKTVDAAGKILGRLASGIAQILLGKDRADFAYHLPSGCGVVVVNAGQVKVTGKKLTDKIYYHHTGYRAGLRQKPLKDLLARHPERVIQNAVWGMLPKGALGRLLFRRLKVFAGNLPEKKAKIKE